MITENKLSIETELVLKNPAEFAEAVAEADWAQERFYRHWAGGLRE